MLLFKYRKDCIAFLSAFKLYNSYRASKPLKSEYIRDEIKKIIVYDSKLAEDINKLLPIIENNNEVDYLISYRNDCDSWRYYDDTYGIDFFIRRVGLFLNGGIEKNIQFKGLSKDFGDKEVRMAMLTDNAIRNLWLYRYQLDYLKRLIELCKKAQKSDAWEGFYGRKGFWTRFNDYAKVFEKGYGNAQFAKILLSKKDEIGEDPRAWGGVWETRESNDPKVPGGKKIVDVPVKDGELPKLLRELEEHVYQRQEIIFPASLSLSEILHRRERKLKEQVITKFSRLLRKKRKYLIKRLKEDIVSFINSIESPLSEYNLFLQKLDTTIGKIDFVYIEKETGRLVNAIQSYGNYIKQQLGRGQFLKDFIGFVRIDSADGVKLEAKRRKWEYETFNHLTEDDFKILQELLLMAWNIRRRFGTIHSHIELQLDRKYTLKARDMGLLEISAIKNPDFKFSYINKIFKRLI